MPTPRPIIAASVGPNVAMSMKRAAIDTKPSPAPKPTSAVRMGSPAATSEANIASMMTIASMMPKISLLGGSVPANSIDWPAMPAVRDPEFTSSTSAISALTSPTGTSKSLPRLRPTTPTVPSGLTSPRSAAKGW